MRPLPAHCPSLTLRLRSEHCPASGRVPGSCFRARPAPHWALVSFLHVAQPPSADFGCHMVLDRLTWHSRGGLSSFSTSQSWGTGKGGRLEQSLWGSSQGVQGSEGPPWALGGWSPPARPGTWAVCACAQVCMRAWRSADGPGLGAEPDTVADGRSSGDALCPEALAAAFPCPGSGHLQAAQGSWTHSAMTLGPCHQTGPGRATCTQAPQASPADVPNSASAPRPQGSLTPEVAASALPQGVLPCWAASCLCAGAGQVSPPH